MEAGRTRTRLPRWVTWVGPAFLLLQVVLVRTGVLDLRHAAVVTVVVESALAVVAVVLAVRAGSTFRESRRQGASTQQAFFAATAEVMPGPAATVLKHEVGVITGLVTGLRPKRALPEGIVALGYGQDQRVLMIVLSVLSVGEVALVHLLVPWSWLRIALLVLGAYGILWLVGFTLSVRTRPHTVGPDTVDLRCAHLATVSIPTRAVLSVRPHVRTGDKSVVDVDGAAVAISFAGGTNVTAQLAPGSRVVLDGVRTVPADSVSFMVDDPRTAISVFAEKTRT